MSGLSIVSVTCLPLRLPFHHWTTPPMFAGRPRDKLDSALIRVETQCGLVGWGESYCVEGTALTAIVDTFIGPLSVGVDADDDALIPLIQRTLHNLGRSGPVVHAIAGLDIALWDLKGKAQGVPVHELLGGKVRDRVKAYASLLQYYAKPDLIQENVTRALNEGFTEIKLHERTTLAVRAAREAMGPGLPLMIDTNCAWSVAQAQDEIASMLPYDPFWIEEPVWPPEDTPGLVELRRRLNVRIASGENASSLHQLLERIASRAIDYVQPSVIKLGLTDAWEVSQRCTGTQVTCAPQVAFFGPGYLASLHLLAAQKQEASLERLYLSLAFTPYQSTVPVVDGWVQVPDGPGLGADPDPALIAGHYSR